jgi:hypothetical protein
MIAATSIVAGRLQRRLENKKGQPEPANPLEFNGSPKGNRTPVFAVRGRYPRPLDDGTVDKIAARFYSGWGTRIRTSVNGARTHRPAAERSPNCVS